MSRKVMFASTLFCCFSAFLLAATVSGQSTGPVQVSDVLEGADQRQGGSSAARCGSNIVVGFADIEATSSGTAAGVAVSKDGGQTFSELAPITDSDPTGDYFNWRDNPSVACANA